MGSEHGHEALHALRVDLKMRNHSRFADTHCEILGVKLVGRSTANRSGIIFKA